MKSAISWFEIPAGDIDRAQKFYETILGIRMTQMDMPDMKMRAFPIDDPMAGTGGSLVDSDGFHSPSAEAGVLIYLNANPDVQHVLDRVTEAGGTVLMPKTEISPEYGYMGVIQDTEGNRVGLHSVPEKYLAGN